MHAPESPAPLHQRLLCGGRHAACPPASWAGLAAARGLKSAFVLPILFRDAIEQGQATVVEHNGHISGYATTIGVSGHAVGETTADIQVLIGAASDIERGSFLVPLRHAELFSWCLDQGFRVAVPETLMSQGFYQEPAGAFLPSILY